MHTENLTIYRGDTHTFTIEVSDDDGSPVNLLGADVAMLVAPKGGHPSFNPSINVGGNIIEITFLPSHTKDGCWRNADYDVQVTQDKVVTTILKGRIEMIQDITP